MPIYSHIREGTCGKTLIFPFCFFSFWLQWSNRTLAPCCQSWHVILGNMEINANGLWEESSRTSSVFKCEQRDAPVNNWVWWRRRSREQWSHWVSQDALSIYAETAAVCLHMFSANHCAQTTVHGFTKVPLSTEALMCLYLCLHYSSSTFTSEPNRPLMCSLHILPPN